MNPPLIPIQYSRLNARQKENYNFLKVSAVLADFGYMTMRLTDDWQGADFIASHIDGETLLRVQLKSRLTFQKKYLGKGLHIAFSNASDWYLYPHDELLIIVLGETGVGSTSSWKDKGSYSFPRLSQHLVTLLARYRVGG